MMRLTDNNLEEEKMTALHGWTLCILSKKEDRIPTGNELIDVNMMKKGMTI